MDRTKEQEIEIKNQKICRELVGREVVHCCSYMVSELAKMDSIMNSTDGEAILDMCTGYDYESAAYDEGWRPANMSELHLNDKDVFNYYNNGEGIDEDGFPKLISDADDWQELCDDQNIEPYDREVFEHWIVTEWFAGKLQEHGEIVGELFDFWIWGRCTTGQAILLDGVIRKIAEEMEILSGQKYDWSAPEKKIKVEVRGGVAYCDDPRVEIVDYDNIGR